MVEIMKRISLQEGNPAVANEWDYDANYPLKPEDVALHSNKRVKWICPKGHRYEVAINHRTDKNKPTRCPYCAHEKPWLGENDLATLRPELIKEWDYIENKKLGLSPQSVMVNSNKSAYWICAKGHKWRAVIQSRAKNNNGCPYCAGQKAIKNENDLETLRPDLIKEWDFDLNKNEPYEYKIQSNKKVWWKCLKGHPSYQKTICDKTKGQGCPVCANQKVIQGINDLATTNPELIREWNYEKNEKLGVGIYSVSKGSDKKVWWICNRGHEYQAFIYSRTGKRKSGCPICNNYFKVSLSETIIAYYVKKCFSGTKVSYRPDWMKGKEIDIYVPELNLAIEYDGQFFHQNLERYRKKSSDTRTWFRTHSLS